jgi:3-oxoacyl-[acyl-carrier protein] reductase
MREALISRIGMGRFGRVQEVADVALMLAANEYITGTTITVDGGLTYE